MDKQGKMTTQGGKHTRKFKTTGGFEKNIFVFKKLTTENLELCFLRQVKSRNGDEEKRVKKKYENKEIKIKKGKRRMFQNKKVIRKKGDGEKQIRKH